MSDFDLLEVEDGALERVAQLLNTSTEQLYENVSKLNEWTMNQPHFPKTTDGDEEIVAMKLRTSEEKKLLNFLILNENDLEKAKEKVDAYFTMRTIRSDIFESSNPVKFGFVEGLQRAFYLIPLPKLTRDMCRIFVFKIRDRELALKVDHWNTLRYVLNGQEIRLVEDVCYGDIFIIDAQDIPLRFVLSVSPLWIYRSVQIYEGVYSMPIKAMYLINASSIVRNLLGVVKRLIKPKVFSTIYCHQGYDFLKSTFESRVLPRDFGGEEKSLEELQDMWNLKIAHYADLFDKLDALKTDESLRPVRERQ